MNKKELTINGRTIGENYPPYIIAELSANHNGAIDKALETITMAKKMGADAVKIQTYNADTMTIDCDNPDFMINAGLWKGYNLYQLYQEAHTPFEWHKAMFEHAKNIGITLFSTPFDDTAVDLLEELNCPAYKIASFEITDLALIERVAKTNKPIIMSTGMANINEITEAVKTAKFFGCTELALLHCISAYPVPVEQCNLLTIKDLSNKFEVQSGLSDHTLGTTVAVAASALGASIIEKHVTMSRKEKGPDSQFSIEPHELKQLCSETEVAWQAIGQAGYETKKAEQQNTCFRRSLYIVKDIKRGEIITAKHIRRIRPGYGLAPKYYNEIIGCKALIDIKRGTATSWDMIKK